MTQEDTLFYSQMNEGIPGKNLDKDSPASDPYPTGRHTRSPTEGQEMEARPWGSYGSICFHGHPSTTVPVDSLLNEMVCRSPEPGGQGGEVFVLQSDHTH